jgi:MFS family permease
MSDVPPETPETDDRPWYEGITRYQWIVLLIASLGWVFDIFEGQIFVASMTEAMPSLAPQGEVETSADYDGRMAFYNNVALAAFLIGGAVGGILFGMLSDRIGRKKAMTLTIVFYSLFTCLSAFSVQWWHLAGLRFLVAMGVGGEWAVASSLVYEEFPKRARAHVGGIFHASSIFGTWLAIAAGAFIIGNPYFDDLAEQTGIPSLPWRIGFALGVVPAFLIIWIRKSLKEPASWEEAKQRAAEDQSQQVGRLSELFSAALLRNTLVGFTLAAVGLATFWGVHIYGKNLLQDAVKAELLVEATGEEAPQLSPEEQAGVLAKYENRIKRWEMIGMFLVTTGGGLGLVLFGPISQRIGRRPAFLFYHVAGLIIALFMFNAELSRDQLAVLLPVFGFLTLGMHAGYAIYFPELFPTRLRGTGTGFCFNGGRIAAAPILLLSGWLQRGYTFETSWLNFEIPQIGLHQSCTYLSLLYLIGALVLLAAPETRQRRR